MSTVNAGLAWGVPVQPELLCQHLQAYKKILPRLTALRLCHRFGQGSNVHITKLPIDIEQAIEGILVRKKLSSTMSRWQSSFRHFEGRCEPVDHLQDGYPDIFLEVRDEIHDELCDKCKDEEYCSDDCSQSCREKIEEAMNVGLAENGGYREICDEESMRWEDLIDQKANGNFAQYDKILREHFGLEVYFATTRINDRNRAAWPAHPNHTWHIEHELRTTVCYLTLPKQMSGNAVYQTSDMEDSMGFVCMKGSLSCSIEPSTLNDANKRVKQFQRALRVLQLKPSLHPSQMVSKVSANAASEHASEEEGVEGEVIAQMKEPAEAEWPKLMMLVKTSFLFEA